MTDLEKARREINDVDREMAELFQRRMAAAREVARYKKEHGIPVTDAAREKEVIRRNSAFVENDELRAYYVNFLQYNMDLSKKYQSRLLDGMRVAFSGVEGAFANIAANLIFPDAKAIPHPSFQSAYEAAARGDCDCVLLPIENSFNGDVGQVMDLAFFGPLFINGVYELEVVQNLLAVRGATMETVREVISHPQALGQCAGYLEKHGFLPREAANTALAARTVAEAGRTDLAAIASEQAAEEYGLIKLDSHINESSQNTTRFAVFSRAPKTPSPADNRFIMVFTVKNEAGSLGRAVSIIGDHKFNLRALKSRPTKDLIWNYYFYAEGEGNLHTEEGHRLLEDLKSVCSDLKVVGTYEKEITIK